VDNNHFLSWNPKYTSMYKCLINLPIDMCPNITIEMDAFHKFIPAIILKRNDQCSDKIYREYFMSVVKTNSLANI
jgi:hypothetical protein